MRQRCILRSAGVALLVWLAGASAAQAQLLIDTIAGASNGDGFTADLAKFSPSDVAYDGQGNAFVADLTGNRIRRIDHNTNIITTVAGTGEAGFSGDGSAATQAKLFYPSHVVLDSGGDVYFSDQLNHRVRRIDAHSQHIDTVAGNGTTSGGNDNGPAVEASLSFPSGLAFLPDGSLLIAESGHNRIRRVFQGNISTVVGTGATGYNGDGIDATAATLTNPGDVVADTSGNYYIADTGNCRIRVVQAQNNLIFTLGGAAGCGSTGNGGPAVDAKLNAPFFVALGGNGLYLTESLAPRVRRIDLTSNTITGVAGNGLTGSGGDGGPATQARLNDPAGIVVDPQNGLVICESGSGRLRRVQDGIINTIAGQSNGDGFSPQLAKINPKGIAQTVQGELWIADSSNNHLRRISSSLTLISNGAGTGTFGFAGDTGPATQALLAAPLGVAVASDGSIYFSDQQNHRIRRIAAGTGTITTIAGTGIPSYGGDDGPATGAGLSFPAGINFGPDGSLYIADSSNNRIRRIAPDGKIATVAGTGFVGYNGENIPAVSALLSNPTDVVIDTDGNYYIADRSSCRIRRVERESGLMTTIAGTGRCGYSGDDGPAVVAQLNGPEYLALLENRYLYISESFTPRVRRIDLFTNVITRLTGNGLPATTGDGGPGLDAQLEMPAGLHVDKDDRVLFISDSAAGRVRRLQIETVPPSTFTPTKTQTFTPTKTATVTQTRTFTVTFTPSNTATNTFTFTQTATRTPTATPTVTSTATRTFTPTPSLTRTFTPTGTNTATPSPSPPFTATATFSRTPTAVFTATATFTRTFTATLTRSPTPTATQSFTRTATASFTATSTLPPSSTATVTLTPPPTSTRTGTATALPSATATSTGLPTSAATSTLTRTATPSFSPTRTTTNTALPTNTPTATTSRTASATITPTRTPTRTPPATATAPPTFTPLPPTPTTPSGPVATPTRTRTVTSTFTRTSTPAATASPTLARTATPTPVQPTPTRTPSLPSTKTRTRTATATPTAVPPTATRTPSPLPGTPTVTGAPTFTFAAGGTPTFTLRPTLTPTITRTPTSLATSTRTSTPVSTRTSTSTPTVTRTFTITATVTPRLSATQTPTLTRTITRTGTPGGPFTPTPTSTASVTPRSSPVATQTGGQSNTPTPSRTFTLVPTATRTAAALPTSTRTITVAPTATRTATLEPSPTRTATSAPATATLTAVPTVTGSPDNGCTGDCNGDLVITSSELNTVLTRVTLCGGAPGGPCLNVGACIRGDTNRDGTITAGELTRAVENAESGCPK